MHYLHNQIFYTQMYFQKSQNQFELMCQMYIQMCTDSKEVRAYLMKICENFILLNRGGRVWAQVCGRFVPWRHVSFGLFCLGSSAGRRRYVPMRKSLSAGSRISFFHFHIPSCAHILVRFAARRRSCPTFCLQPITGIKLRRAALCLWYAHRCTLLKFRLKMCKINIYSLLERIIEMG